MPRISSLSIHPAALLGICLKAQPAHARIIDRHRQREAGNYLRDNFGRLLDKLLDEGKPAVPYA